MLENKDLDLFVNLLNEKENKSEEEIKVLNKLELIVKFNQIKEEYDKKIYEVQDKLKEIYQSEHK